MTSGNPGGPLFVIGSPRSGTSLLRLILTSHSQILIPPECGFIIWLHPKYGNWTREDNNNASQLKSFYDDLYVCKKFDTWQLERAVINKQIVDSQPASYAELCGVVYRSFGISTGKDFTIWGDKNNFHLNHLDELIGLYINARFIHIVRDGRDVACSYRDVMKAELHSPYAPKLDTGIAEIATEWSTNVLKIDAFISRMPREIAMTIRYEDLVKAPSTSVRTICDWLGIAYESEMLEFYRMNMNKKLEPELTLEWKKRTLLPINDETVGRYKYLMNTTEKNEFRKIASIMLSRFSYELL